MKKNWVHLFIALLLYLPLGFLQVSIDYQRKLEDLESGLLLMPGQMAGSLVLSGFKGLAADLLWLNIENYWHSGQHYKMLPLFEAVSWLQPHYITVWAVGGWHMSYNIFAEVGDREDKFKEELEKITEKLSDEKKKKLEIPLKIAEKIHKLKKKMGKKGIPEDKIPEIIGILNRYESILENFPDREKYTSRLNIVKDTVNVPREQIFWYESGIKFLKKGVAYNSDKYDLYFELGWTYYHKGRDYKNAVRYLERAIKFPHPEYVDDVLAHAYEKNGQIDKAIKQWEKLLNSGFKDIAERAIHSLKTTGKFSL